MRWDTNTIRRVADEKVCCLLYMRGLHIRHFSCVLKLLFKEISCIQYTQGKGQIFSISVCLGGNAFVHTMSYLIVQNIPWCHCCVVLHLATHFWHVYFYNIRLNIFSQKTISSLKEHFSLKMNAIKVFKYHQITFRLHSMKVLSLTIS